MIRLDRPVHHEHRRDLVLPSAFPDERALAARDDVLTFTTEPLKRTSRDRRPDQRDARGRDSRALWALVRHRARRPPRTEPPGRSVMDAGAITPRPNVPVRLDLDDVAHRFAAGHAIQLQIKSSDYPWFLVHPGPDENPWFATERRRGRTDLANRW